jgi:hypothetical protein
METIKFSLFHSEIGIKETKPKKEIDLKNLFQILQSEKLIELTQGIRTAPNDLIRDELKLKLPFITPFGTFEMRDKTKIIHYNQNLIAFDFDYLKPHEIEEIKAKAKKSQNVIYCGISPRGNGVKMLMLFNHSFDFENHATNLKHYAKDILKTIGIENDPDPAQFVFSQAMFLSHDENAYYNLFATATNEPLEPFKPIREKHAPKIVIESHSRIDKFLIGSLRKKVEFLVNTNEGARHSAILNTIQIVGLMRYYSPHLENEFYNSLKQAVIVMYGNEQTAIENNALKTLDDIFVKAETRTLDKIEEIISDINNIQRVFHCFEYGEEITLNSDRLFWNYNRTYLKWELNGYPLITMRKTPTESIYSFQVYGIPTRAKIERLNKFYFIEIELLANGKMILNGEVWDGETIEFSLVKETL